MRSTKVIAFSVPPQFETHILKNAKKEHRTVSEYIREAIRHYIQSQGGDISGLKKASTASSPAATSVSKKKKLLSKKKSRSA
jgi:hypothetical protein